jgi:hypothetical protein
MELVDFRPEHAKCIELQPGQAYMKELIDDDYCQSLLEAGPAYTLIEDGKVLAVGGISLIWEGRGLMWSLISDGLHGAQFFRMHRITKRFLDLHPMRRIEITVDHQWPQAHRWAKLLGFKHEAYLPKYAPNGLDADQYVRLQ